MRVLIVGLDHWIQRNQDDCPERVVVRRSFENGIRRLIERERIQLVAEEAGNDDEVAAKLQVEEDLWAPFENRAPRRIEPLETIARTIANETPGCRHIDIRPAGDWVERDRYEQEMIDRTVAGICDARRVLLLCGEDHREGLSKSLVQRGWDVEAHEVDWLLNP